MVRHIVSWNFRPEISEETRKEVWEKLSAAFPALVGKIPGCLKVEVGMPPLSTSNCDASIYVELEDEAAVKVYQTHPEHLAIAEIVRAHCQDRRCVDIKA